MLTQAPFVNRVGFGDFLNSKDLLGEAVEIGTHRADFAVAFLRRWKGGILFYVDPWIPGYNDRDYVSTGNRLEDYRETRRKLLPFPNRAKILKCSSAEAVGSNIFKDQSLDFVYIDGNHDPAYFKEDLTKWWWKVRTGGIIAGHDIICPNEKDGGWGKGIQSILLPFAEQVARDIYLVIEEDNSPWSFYLIR